MPAPQNTYASSDQTTRFPVQNVGESTNVLGYQDNQQSSHGSQPFKLLNKEKTVSEYLRRYGSEHHHGPHPPTYHQLKSSRVATNFTHSNGLNTQPQPVTKRSESPVDLLRSIDLRNLLPTPIVTLRSTSPLLEFHASPRSVDQVTSPSHRAETDPNTIYTVQFKRRLGSYTASVGESFPVSAFVLVETADPVGVDIGVVVEVMTAKDYETKLERALAKHKKNRRISKKVPHGIILREATVAERQRLPMKEHAEQSALEVEQEVFQRDPIYRYRTHRPPVRDIFSSEMCVICVHSNGFE
eukprot:gene33611-41472_t